MHQRTLRPIRQGLGRSESADVVAEFVLGHAPEQLPSRARRRLCWLVLDFAAVLIAGRVTPCAEIAADYAVAAHGGSESRLVFDGRAVSALGAAWANGVLGNALDFDDGHRDVKGHPGAVVISAALAVAERQDTEPRELLAAIAVGYEVAIRVGVRMHERTSTYHGSGAWGAVGAAAACARLLKLDSGSLQHALGLAEYHAPMAPIIRSTNDPAMTKDGIGWGALVGVASALQAQAGFTSTASAAADVLAHSDLAEAWRVAECYVKPYPCCRWAHPAIRAAGELFAECGLKDAEIHEVVVDGFSAVGELARRPLPSSTEEAQYSLVWPVAATLVHGDFGVDHVTAIGLHDTAVRSLAQRVRFRVDEAMDAQFPRRRESSVTVHHAGGAVSSPVVQARGEPEDPLWESVPTSKFDRYWPKRQTVIGALEGLVQLTCQDLSVSVAP